MFQAVGLLIPYVLLLQQRLVLLQPVQWEQKSEVRIFQNENMFSDIVCNYINHIYNARNKISFSK